MKHLVSISFFLIGISLLLVNLYGLTQNIRPATITNDDLRFYNDQPLPYNDVIAQLTQLPNESDNEFSFRATNVIAQGLAHIHWERFEPEKFNQVVPIWENYFLFFMAKFTNIPEYKRYHFADYKRSLKRGIGICGDASMILSQVLNNHNIENKILTYPGHVVVEAKFSNQQSAILDADFGVNIPFSKDVTKEHYQAIAQLYSDKGYTENDRAFFERMYSSDYKVWRDVKHFITKKYYFEQVSYMVKWPFPIILLLIAVYLFKRNLRHNFTYKKSNS